MAEHGLLESYIIWRGLCAKNPDKYKGLMPGASIAKHLDAVISSIPGRSLCPVCNGYMRVKMNGDVIYCLCETIRLTEFTAWKIKEYGISPNKDKSIANYKINHPEDRQALDVVRQFVANVKAGKRLLFLNGSVGVGKTHLVTGMCLAFPGIGAVITEPKIESMITAALDKSFDGDEKQTVANITKYLVSIPVLAIDDYGAGYQGPFAASVISQVLFLRLETSRITAITTNLSVTQQAMSMHPTGVKRILDRMTDKGMADMYTFVQKPSMRQQARELPKGRNE